MKDLLKLDNDEFKVEMKTRTAHIEEILKSYLPENITQQKTIYDAMEYSLMAGGKRLRPMLMLEAYRLFGGKDESIVTPFMAAIEMIHTYSLVHDDLPAMDNDDYRRGRKTTHIVYGEDMGILAGDALLNYAYETVAKSMVSGGKLKLQAKAFAVLSQKAGIYGMVGGQVVDVEMTGKDLSEEQLEFIYRLKTGALLEASLMTGAVLAGASDEEVRAMEKVGRNVGMAFQIQDDILDITSTTEELGKPVHSDEKNAKSTYVAIYGMDESLKAVEEYSEKALNILLEFDMQNAYLNSLIEMLINRKK